MTIDLILGTAGHIDHGKTSLIKALTGVNTDRLPEEKKRGITIELGFAELILQQEGQETFRLGIVDVPGHERFVRNMLAGATGMDIALLVIAADDSVKQQTREHFDILRLLGLEFGVIVITKCDVADADWVELVEEEIRDLVAGSFLENAPIVRTSSHSGLGLDELKQTLYYMAQQAANSPRTQLLQGPFRMPIDRVFTVTGHGTVVTGSVASGQSSVGDELCLQPGDIPVRVRGIQQHDQSAQQVHRGQRAAINLAGIDHDQIKRGQELLSKDFLHPSKLITVELYVLPNSRRPLKNRSRLRVHLGTDEFLASVVILGHDKVEPGGKAFAQLYLGEVSVCAWDQPFVLRTESPVVTIGGGRVLDPVAKKLRNRDTHRLAKLPELTSSDPTIRAAAALHLLGLRQWQHSDLMRIAGITDPQTIIDQLVEQKLLQKIPISPTKEILVHRDAIAEQTTIITAALKKLHTEFPLNAMFDRTRLFSKIDFLGHPALLDALLSVMKKQKLIKISARGIALSGHGPELTKGEQRLVEEIIQAYQEAGFKPPTIKEFTATVTKNQAVVPQLLELAAAEGHLIRISDDFFIHQETEKSLRTLITDALTEKNGLTMSEIREIFNTSRKYSVPLCEYLDRIGVTVRDDELRRLAVSTEKE